MPRAEDRLAMFARKLQATSGFGMVVDETVVAEESGLACTFGRLRRVPRRLACELLLDLFDVCA